MLSKRSVVSNLRKRTESFLKDEVAIFNDSYEGIEFSNIAFSYHPADFQFSFSLNTAFDQNKAVLIFKNIDSDIVRSNPKHWRYQDVAFLDLIDPEHFDAYYKDNIDDFYNLLVSELVKFMNTHIYRSIKKAKDCKITFVVVEPFESIDLN